MNTEQFKDIPQEVFPVLAKPLGRHDEGAIELAKGSTPRLLDERGRLTADGKAALRKQERRIETVNELLEPINEAEREKWVQSDDPKLNYCFGLEPANYPVQLVGPGQWALTPEQLALLAKESDAPKSPEKDSVEVLTQARCAELLGKGTIKAPNAKGKLTEYKVSRKFVNDMVQRGYLTLVERDGKNQVDAASFYEFKGRYPVKSPTNDVTKK